MIVHSERAGTRLLDAAESILAPRVETGPGRRPRRSHQRRKAGGPGKSRENGNDCAELEVTMTLCSSPSQPQLLVLVVFNRCDFLSLTRIILESWDPVPVLPGQTASDSPPSFPLACSGLGLFHDTPHWTYHTRHTISWVDSLTSTQRSNSRPFPSEQTWARRRIRFSFAPDL